MKIILVLLTALLVCINAPAFTPGRGIKEARAAVRAFQPPVPPVNILSRYGKIQSPSTDNVSRNGSIGSNPGVSTNGKLYTPVISLPTVTTASVTYNPNQTSVAAGGNVTNNGNGTITARGICWSTSANPTISNSKTSDGTGTGSFTSTISSLNPNIDITYHVRAYATNSAGTSYGSDITFNLFNYWLN